MARDYLKELTRGKGKEPFLCLPASLWIEALGPKRKAPARRPSERRGADSSQSAPTSVPAPAPPSSTASRSDPRPRLRRAEPSTSGTVEPTFTTLRPAREGPAVQLSPSLAWQPAAEQNAFVLVVGGSGSGKTEALRLFASDLERSRVPVVLLDVHEDLELPGFESIELGERIGLNPLQLPSLAPSAGGPTRHAAAVLDTVRAAAPRIGDVQAYALKSAILGAYAQAGYTADPPSWRRPPPRLGDVLRVLEARAKQERGAQAGSLWGLVSALDALFGDPVFNQDASLSTERLEAGRLRLKLKNIPETAQVLAIDTALRQLFGAVKARGPVPAGTLRSFVVCDEAARLKPSPVLPQIFREARKFGMGMALAAQLADDFTKELRGNAGTLIVLRTTSAAERRQNARELDVSEELLRALDRPGAALVRTLAGTQRVQLRRLGG